MAVRKLGSLLIGSVLALSLVGCGSGSADTDSNTAGLKEPLPTAKPGTVVDPPDPSKSEGTTDLPRTP